MEQGFDGRVGETGRDRDRRRNVFLDSCARRLQELEEEGVFPNHYVESRFAAAKFLKGNFMDPEADGEAFANVGVEERKRFLSAVDAIAEDARSVVMPILERFDDLERRKLSGMIWETAVFRLADIREYLEQPWRGFLDSVDRWKEDQLSLLLTLENPALDRLTWSYGGLTVHDGPVEEEAGSAEEDGFPSVPPISLSADRIGRLISYAENRLLRKASGFLGKMDYILQSKESGIVLLPDFEESVYQGYRKVIDRMDAFHEDSEEIRKRCRILQQVTGDPRWQSVFEAFERAISTAERNGSGNGETSEPSRR